MLATRAGAASHATGCRGPASPLCSRSGLWRSTATCPRPAAVTAAAAAAAAPGASWLRGSQGRGLHQARYQLVVAGAVTKGKKAVVDADNGVPAEWRAAVRLWKKVDWEAHGNLATTWQARYWELVEYVHENRKIPAAGPTGLPRWVKNQKQMCARLRPLQRQLLKAIPYWTHPLEPSPPSPEEFSARYNEYMAMAAKKGAALAVHQSPPAERKLANWVLDMKGLGTCHKGLLTEEQKEALEALPAFSWEIVNTGPFGPRDGRGTMKVVDPGLPFFSLEELGFQ